MFFQDNMFLMSLFIIGGIVWPDILTRIQQEVKKTVVEKDGIWKAGEY